MIHGFCVNVIAVKTGPVKFDYEHQSKGGNAKTIGGLIHSKQDGWSLRRGSLNLTKTVGKQLLYIPSLVFILLRFSERTSIEAGSLLTASKESNPDILQWIYGFLLLCLGAITFRNGLQPAGLWSAERSAGASFFHVLSFFWDGEVEVCSLACCEGDFEGCLMNGNEERAKRNVSRLEGKAMRTLWIDWFLNW